MTLRDLTANEISALQRKANAMLDNYMNNHKNVTVSDAYRQGFSDALRMRLKLEDHHERKTK